jgi:hypothetical protein
MMKNESTSARNSEASLDLKSPRADGQWKVQAVVFAVIVLLGIASRFWLVDWPNFKPVAAMVLFGAFYFRRSWAAVAALIAIMMLSDLKLGVYDWKLAGCVYASLALAGVLGVWIKRSIESGAERRMGALQVGRFAIASIVMSTAFFVLTNAAVWAMGQWYPATWSGLVSCYASAVPFYRATLVGDLFFSGVIVAGYCAVESLQLAALKSANSFAIARVG